MKKAEAILFDLDGTMWDAVDGILKSWNLVLERHKDFPRGPITADELSKCLGKPMTEIAMMLFPMCSEEEQQSLMDECCEG